MTKGEAPARRTLSQWFFGRPKIWVSCVWLALGVVWLVLAISDARAFHYFMAAFWILMGGAMLIVALRDRARRSDQ